MTPARARLGTASASFLLPGPEALCRPRAQRPCRREWRGASAAGAAGGTVPAPGGARPAAATSPVHCRLKASVCWKPGVARFHQAPFGATVSRTQTRTVRQAVPRPWLRGRRQTCARTSRPPCAPPCAGLSCVFASQAPQRSSPAPAPPGRSRRKSPPARRSGLVTSLAQAAREEAVHSGHGGPSRPPAHTWSPDAGQVPPAEPLPRQHQRGRRARETGASKLPAAAAPLDCSSASRHVGPRGRSHAAVFLN